MFGHRHQLDVAEPHLADIGHQSRCQLVPCRNAPVRMEPRCGVHFVDRDRRVGIVPPRALPHPRFVVPDMRRGIADNGCGRWRRFGRARQGISLERQTPTVWTDDAQTCSACRPEPWDEQLPHARGIAQTHRVSPRIPGVEVANHGNRACVRRPDGKTHTADAIDCHNAGAKMRRQFKMPPFVEQMQIKVAEQRPEGIWIFGFLHRVRPDDAQPIRLGAAHPADEQSLRRGRRQPPQWFASFACQYLDFQRAGQESADLPSHRGVMRTQYGEWITECAGGERFRHARRQTGKFSHVVHDGTCAISWARPCSGTSIHVGRLAAS